jgi:hypothetical protein
MFNRILGLRSLSLIGLLAACLSPAQEIPAADPRNTNIITTDTVFPMPKFASRPTWEAHAARLRKQIQFAAGLDPMPARTPLHPQIFGRIERNGYSIEKVLLDTMPGFYLGGNLYRPLGKSGKLPAIATPHGHWNYGRLEHTPLGSIPARAIHLARQGYVVFAYDMVGYNDTQQTPHDFGATQREQLWSFGPLGLQTWNSIRVVDFLSSLPDVDPERIGATGASGGGTQTFLLTALDSRVRWSAPVNMISGIMQGGSACENAPGLRFDTFNVEIGALMAPRPMLMVSAKGDWTRNTPQNEFPAMKGIYALYDKATLVESVHVDAPHNYNKESREAMYKFFAKHMLGVGDPGPAFQERNIQVEPLPNMLALFGRALPAGALTFEQILEQWVRWAREQNAALPPSRERLLLALGAEWPAQVAAEVKGNEVRLSRAGKDLVRLTRRGAATPATLVVNEDGSAAGALSLTAFQTGAAVAPRDRSHRHFLAFNRTDDANRVQDILTALRWMEQQGVKSPALECSGKAAIWCTFAAAVSPVRVQVKAPLGNFRGTDEELARDFFVPGLQRAGGLAAALALAGAR